MVIGHTYGARWGVLIHCIMIESRRLSRLSPKRCLGTRVKLKRRVLISVLYLVPCWRSSRLPPVPIHKLSCLHGKSTVILHPPTVQVRTLISAAPPLPLQVILRVFRESSGACWLGEGYSTLVPHKERWAKRQESSTNDLNQPLGNQKLFKENYI